MVFGDDEGRSPGAKERTQIAVGARLDAGRLIDEIPDATF